MSSLISKGLRFLLAAWFMRLVDKGYLTSGQVDQILLALAIFLTAVISHVISSIVHRLKLDVAAQSEAGTPVAQIKAEAWALFLQKLNLLNRKDSDETPK